MPTADVHKFQILKKNSRDDEIIEVDKSQLNPEQLDTVRLLYDMCLNEQNLEEKQNLRHQMLEYLKMNKINYRQNMVTSKSSSSSDKDFSSQGMVVGEIPRS